jgi:hypothetical protein
MGTNYNPRIVTNGLVLALDAANPKSYTGSGTAWNDLSGRGNTGTLVNGPTYSSANRGSIVFDGTNDTTTFVGNNVSGLAELATEFSISAWVKYNSIASYGAFMTKQNSAGSTSGTPRLDLGFIPNLVYLTTYNSSTGVIDQGIFTYPINTSSWYNIVLVCGNSLKQGYLNNQLQLSSSFTSTYPDNTQVLGIPNLRPINGNIAQVSMYNRALTPAEVYQNFNALRGRYNI